MGSGSLFYSLNHQNLAQCTHTNENVRYNILRKVIPTALSQGIEWDECSLGVFLNAAHRFLL
jgi:hypothetical protein